jgi:cell division protein FtsW
MRAKPTLVKTRRSALATPDWSIVLVVVGLIAFGLLMVFDASMVQAFHELGDEWYFIRNQTKFAVFGLIALGLATLFPIKSLEKWSLPIFISAIVLLVLVLIPGIGVVVQGAQRWINIGPIRLQPSEYAKLASIIYMSAWFSKPRPARSFFVFIGGIIGLIMLQPDLGTALVIASIAASMYFLSGVELKKIAKLAIIGIAAVIILIAFSPYRMNRVKTFFDPQSDPLGASYHVRQVLISLGSGGFSGTGLGRSRQKFQYLPEASTDSIFAVVGEEFGFIGGFGVIAAFSFIVIRGFKAVRLISDTYIATLASGIVLWISIQVTLNLMAIVALVPLTGIPLPLISYGGSALVTIMTGIGFLLNATRYRQPAPTRYNRFERKRA